MTKPAGENRGVSVRMHTIEDAARLAMGDSMTDDRPVGVANATNATLRVAMIAGVLTLAALGLAYF